MEIITFIRKIKELASSSYILSNISNLIKLILEHIKIIFYVLLIIVIPCIVSYYLKHNTITNENAVLIGFLGSYFGGVATLVAVLISIKETKDIQNENKYKEMEQEHRNIMPVISLSETTPPFILMSVFSKAEPVDIA